MRAVECCYREGSDGGVLVCGAASANGCRTEQQDRFILQPKPPAPVHSGKNLFQTRSPPQTTIAVLDGHICSDVAKHLQTVLPGAFANVCLFDNQPPSKTHEFAPQTHEFKAVQEQVGRICLAIDHTMTNPLPSPPTPTKLNHPSKVPEADPNTKHLPSNGLDVKFSGGSTACICLPSPIPSDDRILLANIGDSRALILTPPKIISTIPISAQILAPQMPHVPSLIIPQVPIMSMISPSPLVAIPAPTFKMDGKEWGWRQPLADHVAVVDSERGRIVSSGATVEDGCVNGVLSLSRAFGDRNFKRYDVFGRLQSDTSQDRHLLLDPTRQPITALPDVCLERLAKDELLILCTDGITCALSNDQICSFVANEISLFGGIELKSCQLKSHDLADIAQKLCRHAIKAGSKDNVTVIIAHRPHTNDNTALVCGPMASEEKCWWDYTDGPYYSLSPSFHEAFVTTAKTFGCTESQIEQLIERGKTIVSSLYDSKNSSPQPNDKKRSNSFVSSQIQSNPSTNPSPKRQRLCPL